MTTLKKTLAATTASFIALTGAAYADGHALDINSARLDVSLDANGDGEVDNDELIRGNVAIFDANENGVIDANERGVAEIMLRTGTMVEPAMVADAMANGLEFEFDVDAARFDTTLDFNGDQEVDDDEIIRGNMALFDTNGNGSVDANERGVAEQALRSGRVIVVAAETTPGTGGIEFDANTARLDLTLDTDNDGMVDNDELIDANVAVFDTNGNGVVDADERGVAEQLLENS